MARVWLVTGASSGFGHALVEVILDRGDYVVIGARRTEALKAARFLPFRSGACCDA